MESKSLMILLAAQELLLLILIGPLDGRVHRKQHRVPSPCADISRIERRERRVLGPVMHDVLIEDEHVALLHVVRSESRAVAQTGVLLLLEATLHLSRRALRHIRALRLAGIQVNDDGQAVFGLLGTLDSDSILDQRLTQRRIPVKFLSLRARRRPKELERAAILAIHIVDSELLE